MRKSNIKKHKANAQKLADYLATRNAKKIGDIKTKFQELEDGVWIDKSEDMVKYLSCDKQYGLLKVFMNIHDGVKARILNIGVDGESIESLQVAVMKKNGTAVSFWANDIPSLLKEECVQNFAFIYSMTYENDCSVMPIGRECDIFQSGDEKEMCLMVIKKKAG